MAGGEREEGYCHGVFGLHHLEVIICCISSSCSADYDGRWHLLETLWDRRCWLRLNEEQFGMVVGRQARKR